MLGDFSEHRRRPTNSAVPGAHGLKATRESKTAAVTGAWEFVWEDPTRCLPPTSFFAKHCQPKE